MGIKGLVRLIHAREYKLLDDLKLCDSTVIIDGSELLYYLYFECVEDDCAEDDCVKGDCMKDNGRRGGEYSELRRVIFRFFNTLVVRCNVRCYVIFDEFTSVDNISRYLKRRTDKLENIRSVVDNNKNNKPQHTKKKKPHKAQPIVGRDVLKQTLRELGVPYVVVPGDGDSVIAAVANQLDGYVLASDTDFCVYDLIKGFLPFSDFDWKDQDNGKCPCKIFHRQKLESKFGLRVNAIYFLEPILRVQGGLGSVYSRPLIDALSSIPTESAFCHLMSLLAWLGKNYVNDDSVVKFWRLHVRNLPEDDLKRCLERYRNLPDVAAIIVDLEQGGHRISKGKKCFYAVSVFGDFMPIVPDDEDRPSCNQVSSSIRHAMYQVNPPDDVEEQELETYQVLVADRKGSQYTTEMETVTIDRTKMEALQLNLEYDVLMERADKNDIIKQRRLYIFDVLLRGENDRIIEYFGDDMKLLAAVFRYWSTSGEDQERHVEAAIKALAFTICATYYETALPPGIEEIPRSSFDKQALHSSSQWLSCINDAICLNSILGEPLKCPVIGKLFSGILYQRTFAYFLRTDDLDRADASLFSDTIARDAFANLLRIASGMD